MLVLTFLFLFTDVHIRSPKTLNYLLKQYTLVYKPVVLFMLYYVKYTLFLFPFPHQVMKTYFRYYILQEGLSKLFFNHRESLFTSLGSLNIIMISFTMIHFNYVFIFHVDIVCSSKLFSTLYTHGPAWCCPQIGTQ